jgi:hypothetical protein
LEKRGVPTVSNITSEFVTLAETCAIGLGIDHLPIAVIEHPLGGIDPGLAAAKADRVIEDIIDKAINAMPKSSASSTDPYPAPFVSVKDNLEEVNELFYRNAWCDGLPIIPPTKERVNHMLSGTRYNPDQIIGLIPPRMGAATVQMIAINAVMAGAKPEHLPVIMAAIEAALKPEVELRRWQSTTRPSFITLFVQGPIVKELGIHSRQSALFPGPKPNAVIGRAFNLTTRLLGGVTSPPDSVGTMTTLGLPIYSSCLGENEDDLPEGWTPLRLETGFTLKDSVVSVFGTTVPLLQNDHDSKDGKGVLMSTCDLIGGQLGRAGGEDPGGMVILFGPEHAASIAADGFSMKAVKEFIFENAKTPRKQILRCGLWHLNYEDQPDWIKEEVANGTPMIHQFDSPEQITMSIAGGFGKQSLLRVGYKNPPPALIVT